MLSCNKCDFTAVHVTMLKKFNKNFHSSLHKVKVQYVNMLDELNRVIIDGDISNWMWKKYWTYSRDFYSNI